MIRSLARVLAGFVLACLTAGLVQVLFARPPGALLGAPASEFAGRASDLAVLVLLAATHAAIFAAAFGLIAAGIGEWTGTRAVGYYLLTGAIIAMLGFTAQYSSEAPGQATVLNNYALMAFLTSGLFAGLVYWLVAGRKAGGGNDDNAGRGHASDEDTIGVPPPARTWKNRPRLIIEDAPKPGTKDAKKASLAERLSETGATAKAGVASVVAKASREMANAAATPVGSIGPEPKAEQSKSAQPVIVATPKPAAATSVPATKPAAASKPDDAAGAEPKKP